MKRQALLIEPPRSRVAGSRRAPPYTIPQAQSVRGFPALRPGPSRCPRCPPPARGFTTRDVVSRWDVIQAHTRATPSPLPSSSIPCSTACASPFARCKSTVAGSSPPSSSRPASNGGCICMCSHPAPPKLNGSVERAQRTHTEEFYQLTTYSLHMNNSTENCGSGNGSITPYVLTSRSAT